MGTLLSRVFVAHQPNYLPWLGLFYKAGKADVWVVADDVQYTTHSLINRNRIRTADGWQWLTVPVLTKGCGMQRICDVEIDTTRTWQRKHWEALRWNYGKAPYFDDHAGFFEGVYRQKWSRLIDLNVVISEYLVRALGIDVEIRKSSELHLRQERTLRLIDMTVACGCNVYLAGGGASRAYLDEAVFQEAGIACRFGEFQHPVYTQRFPGFEPRMAAIDLLFNYGPSSREVLFGSR
ncbi:MAG: WbqC family protein [Candidatus Latescibacteria bacterium]|nr:WbqC family protein [Candidatus Latescibacterota bacterium]